MLLPINVFEAGVAILVAMHVENNTAKYRMRMTKRFHLSLLDNCITMSDRLREAIEGELLKERQPVFRRRLSTIYLAHRGRHGLGQGLTYPKNHPLQRSPLHPAKLLVHAM